MSHMNDLIGVVRGARAVVGAGLHLRGDSYRLMWNNSSLRQMLQSCPTNTLTALKPTPGLPKELVERAQVVIQGLKEYAMLNVPNYKASGEKKSAMDPELNKEIEELNREFNETFDTLKKSDRRPAAVGAADEVAGHMDGVRTELVAGGVGAPAALAGGVGAPPALAGGVRAAPALAQLQAEGVAAGPGTVPKPVAKKKIRVALDASSKARVVPSSRAGRLLSFGSLAAGLGAGTAAQLARNAVLAARGLPARPGGSAFMTPANAERIVNTLCTVRGAALKLGQLLSMQDESLVSPELVAIFERVRRAADFMPSWQVERVMSGQLGAEWRSQVQHFEDKPFAAASIGQVHRAVLLPAGGGGEVAVKVQYPGVAAGIGSDIDNLVAVLKVWNVFPSGMFITNLVEVAKKELACEVDYVREAEWTRRFKVLLAPYGEYFVPGVIDELSAAQVLTTELVDGAPLEQLLPGGGGGGHEVGHEVRRDVCRKIMRLCLREMFVLRCMQTDPNWANFLYNHDTGQVILLDFGATREYSEQFMDQYIEIIKGAADGDRGAVLRMSREMRFLTGYETKIMEDTHVDTVMIMGEVFTSEEFDFGVQSTTKRIQALVPTILHHRLCPPPEEIYSLHRKLSGVFLLCSKMKVKMNCREIFQEVYDQYKSNTVR